MADTKISGLTALTGANAVSGDLLTIVDISDTTMAATGTNKSISLTQLQSAPVSAGTANGVLYLNGSKVATSGSALTFDGSQLDIPAGSAAAPSLSTTADPNTGMFFPAADTIAFSEGGVESLRINSSGNVGIGTTSPISKLSVHGGTGDTSATDAVLSLTRASSTGNVHSIKFVNTQKNTNYGNLVVRVKTTASGAESDAYYTDVLTIDGQNGNLGVGTSPDSKLTVVGATAGTGPAGLRIGYNGTSVNYFDADTQYFRNGAGSNSLILAATAQQYYISGSEQMRLTSTGLGIGTSSPGAKLDVQGSSPFARVKENSTGYMGFRGQNDSGNFYFGIDSSTGSFYGSAYARVLYSDGAYPMVFYTNATERMRLDSSGNLGLGGTSFGSGAKVFFLANATAPSSNPTGGGILYVEGGALKFRGSSGTVTTIAAA